MRAYQARTTKTKIQPQSKQKQCQKYSSQKNNSSRCCEDHKLFYTGASCCVSGNELGYILLKK